jgi:hypothetical protein
MFAKSSLTIILGAGFSKRAGLPLASQITDYFTRDNSKQILCFSSAEMKWYDFANPTYRHNGRISPDYLVWGYILNELVSEFIKQQGSFSNYEDFYQFSIDLLNNNDNKIEDIFSAAMEAAIKKENYFSLLNPHHKDNISPFKNKPRTEVRSLINHLIGDLLYIRKTREEINQIYSPFVQYLQGHSSIDIITLNHDTLVEYLIKEQLHQDYSDGYSRNQKILFLDDKPLNVYSGDFDGAVTLIKLHGSLDIYRYDYYDEKGSVANLTEEYAYYKTLDFYEKQSPIRKHPESNEIIQRFHREISPQFITGTRKDEIISSDKMYADLYEKFNIHINRNSTLLIIGYSFMDGHVNKKIEAALKSGVVKRVIHINPMIKFPDRYSFSDIEITNFNTIEELAGCRS